MIGAFVVLPPISVAVCGLAGRKPAARARAVVFGAAPSRGRAVLAAMRTHVTAGAPDERGNVTPPNAVAEPGPAPASAAAAAPGEPRAPESAADAVASPLPLPDASPTPNGPEQDLAHVRLWSATFAGGRALARIAKATEGSGASPPTRTLGGVLRRALSHGALAPAPDARTSVPGMRAQALAGEASAALWLLAPGEGWGEPIVRARITVRDLGPGRWRVTWIDDVSGAELATEERDLGSVAVLSVPTFARHVAAILERADAP